MLTFDQTKHEYKIDGVRVPSVTQVIWDLLPGYEAGDWYLERGTAVHACAALIAAGLAAGQDFDHDPTISGQVAACHRFFAEVKPAVIEIEDQVVSEPYKFAGTLDLLAMLDGKFVVIDWKAHVDERCGWQLAAYAMCLPVKIATGYGVQLNEDGTYKMTPFKLASYAREFLAMRAVFGIRERMGLTKRG
jgi:hypothetical protein